MDTEKPKTDISSQTNRLIKVLRTLESDIKQQNSLRYALLRGMVYGLGTVIGATVLVALFGGVIITIINTLTDSNIDETTIEKVFHR
jgi:hypothetical protein